MSIIQAATLSLNVPAITALCKGARGSIIYATSGLPTNVNNTYGGNPGLSADFYIDTSTGLYYGPKTDIWPATPIFTLNLPVSSYPLAFIPGTSSLTIPTYGTNTISLSSVNSSIFGGTGNALTGDNSFIIGSNITAAITGFTLVNNLSSTGTIYASAGNSNLWYSGYTNTSSNSANWQGTYTTVSANSAYWSGSTPIVAANSATWVSTYTTVSAGSASWQLAFDVINAFSYLTYTYNAGVSSIIPAHGTNYATGSASNVGGGQYNAATGCYSSVLGGVYNTASGDYSSITSGYSSRTLNSKYSNVAGGICNTASGYASTIAGGCGNVACGHNSAVASGYLNSSSNCGTFIGGGRFNTASGLRSSVVGGICNTASGDYSFVAGGSANSTKGYKSTFILGTDLSASRDNFTYVSNLSVQGNSISSGTWVSNTYSGVSGDGIILDYLPGSPGLGRITVGGGPGPADSLAFYNNGPGQSTPTATMYLSANGYVGIGTTTPNALLSFGTNTVGVPSQPNVLRLYDLATSGVGSYGFGMSPSLMSIFSSANTLFTVGSQVSAMYINSSGNVGIGAGSTPTARLDVRGGNASFQNTGNGATNEVDIFLGLQTGGSVQGYIYGADSAMGMYSPYGGSLLIGKTTANPTVAITAGAGSNANFNVAVNSISNVIYANNLGYVGINTPSPAALLHVNNSNYAAIQLGNNIAGNGFTITKESTDNTFNIWTGVIGSNTRRLQIDQSGNVGIGTTAGATKGQLAVVGSGQTTANLNTVGNLGGSIVLGDTGSSPGNGGAVYFAANSTAWNFAAIKGYATNGSGNSIGDITFSTRTNTANGTLSEAMRITSPGLVGIGTASPTQALTVIGNISATGSFFAGNGGGTLYADATNLALRPPAAAYPNGATFFQNNAGTVTTMYVDSNTNNRVGIGTVTPATTLQVNGEANFLTVSETKATPAIAASVLTLNLATATLFYVTLNSSIGTVTLSNPPASPRVFSFTLQLVGDGTARTISWPGTVRWQGGIAPTPTPTLNKVDTYIFFTHDGGSNYFAFIAGQNA